MTSRSPSSSRGRRGRTRKTTTTKPTSFLLVRDVHAKEMGDKVQAGWPLLLISLCTYSSLCLTNIDNVDRQQQHDAACRSYSYVNIRRRTLMSLTTSRILLRSIVVALDLPFWICVSRGTSKSTVRIVQRQASETAKSQITSFPAA